MAFLLRPRIPQSDCEPCNKSAAQDLNIDLDPALSCLHSNNSQQRDEQARFATLWRPVKKKATLGERELERGLEPAQTQHFTFLELRNLLKNTAARERKNCLVALDQAKTRVDRLRRNGADGAQVKEASDQWQFLERWLDRIEQVGHLKELVKALSLTLSFATQIQHFMTEGSFNFAEKGVDHPDYEKDDADSDGDSVILVDSALESGVLPVSLDNSRSSGPELEVGPDLRVNVADASDPSTRTLLKPHADLPKNSMRMEASETESTRAKRPATARDYGFPRKRRKKTTRAPGLLSKLTQKAQRERERLLTELERPGQSPSVHRWNLMQTKVSQQRAQI